MRQRYFNQKNENPGKLFKELANAINKIYPVGINAFDDEYYEYPGIIEAQEIINEAVNPIDKKKNHFVKMWHKSLKDLNSSSDLKVNNTTGGFLRGFSADWIIERFEDKTLIRTKRISFAVSILAPFYSICGVDETFIKERADTFAVGYHSINVVTASPYEEFQTDFLKIKSVLEKRFQHYKFLPFDVCMMFIKDVTTLASGGQEGTIYNALFNNAFNFYTHYQSRGDRRYGFDEDSRMRVKLSPPASSN